MVNQPTRQEPCQCSMSRNTCATVLTIISMKPHTSHAVLYKLIPTNYEDPLHPVQCYHHRNAIPDENLNHSSASVSCFRMQSWQIATNDESERKRIAKLPLIHQFHLSQYPTYRAMIEQRENFPNQTPNGVRSPCHQDMYVFRPESRNHPTIETHSK